jgi:hypothetical protein
MNPLFSSEKNKVPISDDGSGKFSQIKEKLCAKRLQLEKQIQKESTNDLRSELELLRASMRTFGITEIDYIAYEAKNKS